MCKYRILKGNFKGRYQCIVYMFINLVVYEMIVCERPDPEGVVGGGRLVQPAKRSH